MKRRLAFAAVIALGLTLAGCASAPDHGIIHAKDYVPAWVSFIPAGKTIIPIYHPAEWEFDLYASKDDHGWVDVDETTYNRFKVGDEFTVGQ